jgi:hypothetical protein
MAKKATLGLTRVAKNKQTRCFISFSVTWQSCREIPGHRPIALRLQLSLDLPLSEEKLKFGVSQNSIGRNKISFRNSICHIPDLTQ